MEFNDSPLSTRTYSTALIWEPVDAILTHAQLIEAAPPTQATLRPITILSTVMMACTSVKISLVSINDQLNKQVLPPPVETGQFTSWGFSENIRRYGLLGSMGWP